MHKLLAFKPERANINVLRRNIVTAPPDCRGGSMTPKAKKPAVALAVAAKPESAIPPESAATPAKASRGYPDQGYYEKLEHLSHENLAAVVKANAALAEGFEALAKEAAVYARDGFAAASEAAKGLLTAKTLDEVIEINASLAKSGLEALLAGSARLSELSIAAAQGLWTPLGGRIEAALVTLSKPAA
jgi:hypothetical protein